MTFWNLKTFMISRKHLIWLKDMISIRLEVLYPSDARGKSWANPLSIWVPFQDNHLDATLHIDAGEFILRLNTLLTFQEINQGFMLTWLSNFWLPILIFFKVGTFPTQDNFIFCLPIANISHRSATVFFTQNIPFHANYEFSPIPQVTSNSWASDMVFSILLPIHWITHKVGDPLPGPFSYHQH